MNHLFAYFCAKSALPNWWPPDSVIIYIPPPKCDAKHIDAFVHRSADKASAAAASRILNDIYLRISVWKSLLWKMHPFYQWHGIVVATVWFHPSPPSATWFMECLHSFFDKNHNSNTLKGWRVRACAGHASNHKIGKICLHSYELMARHHCRANNILGAPATQTTLNNIKTCNLWTR